MLEVFRVQRPDDMHQSACNGRLKQDVAVDKADSLMILKDFDLPYAA